MNRIRRTAAAVLAVGAVVALTSACSSDAPADAAGSGTTAITIVTAPINYELPNIALQQGFFTEQGLDVTINAGGTPQDNLAQIMGGSADLTIVSWDTMVTSSAEDIPVLAVAGAGVVSETVDTSGLLVGADSGIASVADLAGKTIAFNDLGGGPHIVTQQAFAAAGLAPTDFEAVKLPFASMQAALEAGQVDAVFPSDSFYEQMSANPAFTVVANPTREFRAGLPITLWAATQPWLAENPETATKFIAAMEQAQAFYEDPANHDTIIQLRQDIGQVTPEQAEAMKAEFEVSLPLAVTQSVTDALVTYGAVDNAENVKTSRELIWAESPTRD